HTNELQAFFIFVVKLVAETRLVNIFVDALNKASDNTNNRHTSLQIISDFYKLNDILHRKQLRFAICFSCRHFPIVADNKSRDIYIKYENQVNISIYVRNKL
ncbi:hypothetical protein DL98DRAFT_395166, partial [Cadophora sp. DSE1049]